MGTVLGVLTQLICRLSQELKRREPHFMPPTLTTLQMLDIVMRLPTAELPECCFSTASPDVYTLEHDLQLLSTRLADLTYACEFLPHLTTACAHNDAPAPRHILKFVVPSPLPPSLTAYPHLPVFRDFLLNHETLGTAAAALSSANGLSSWSSWDFLTPFCFFTEFTSSCEDWLSEGDSLGYPVYPSMSWASAVHAAFSVQHTVGQFLWTSPFRPPCHTPTFVSPFHCPPHPHLSATNPVFLPASVPPLCSDMNQGLSATHAIDAIVHQTSAKSPFTMIAPLPAAVDLPSALPDLLQPHFQTYDFVPLSPFHTLLGVLFQPP